MDDGADPDDQVEVQSGGVELAPLIQLEEGSKAKEH